MERGPHIARALHRCLPGCFETAVTRLLALLTPPLTRTEGNGLAVFFYYPHTCFIAEYGLDPQRNLGRVPFETSMRAQYQLTKRFSAEFSIGPFLLRQQERTLARLADWTADPDPHVRRLCSEGTRPRLPWAPRIPSFVKNPTLTLPVLEVLKDDPCLYVRRSVANHLGDLAKDHLDVALVVCERWLGVASPEVNWVQRQQERLRYPEYLRRGFPIGSGAVEGACKYVVTDRFKQSGMRSKLETADPVLHLRAALHTLDLRPFAGGKAAPSAARAYRTRESHPTLDFKSPMPPQLLCVRSGNSQRGD